MKPTSIVFIVISVVLVVIGIVLCFVGSSMAKNQDLALYYDSVNEDKYGVNTYSINNLSTIDIDLDNCNVNIIGASEKSYVDVIDFSNKAYDITITGSKLAIKNSTVWSLFTNIKINEAGFGFNGLRGYLNRDKNENKTVNIYITNENLPSDINIKVGNGNVKFSNFKFQSQANIVLDNGNVKLYKVSSSGKLSSVVNQGLVTIHKCDISETSIDIKEKGNLECAISKQVSFNLTCDNGSITLGDENVGDAYSGVYPSTEIVSQSPSTEENVEDTQANNVDGENATDVVSSGPNLVNANIAKGDITVNLPE